MAIIEPPRPCSMSTGAAALNVRHTPLRLMSSIACHFASGISQNRSHVTTAGIGDHDVEPTELLDTGRDRGVEIVLAADVALAGDDPPTRLLDQPDGLGEVLWVATG